MLLLIYKSLAYDSHLCGVCLAEVSRSMDFSGRWLPERFPYATPPRFDSGYMFGVSLRLLLEEFHIFYVKGIRRSTLGSHWKSERYFNKQLL